MKPKRYHFTDIIKEYHDGIDCRVLSYILYRIHGQVLKNYWTPNPYMDDTPLIHDARRIELVMDLADLFLERPQEQ